MSILCRVFLLNICIKEVNKVVYSNIKEICFQKGISVASVEREAGLKNGAISKWDKCKPLAENLNAAAKVLNVPIEELLGNNS